MPTAPRATALIGLRPRPEREAEFREWQRRITTVAVHQEGFQGTEIFPPVPGVQEEFIVVVRFDTVENLERWMASEDRARLLPEAADLLLEPPTYQVLAGRQAAGQAVTEVIAFHVDPQREQDYLAWQREMDGVVARAPGFLSTELFPPSTGRDDWTVVLRFDTHAHLEEWFASPARQRMLDRADPFAERFQHRRLATGFGSWFEGSARSGDLVVLPPRWKQALTVLTPLYPTVMVVSLLLLPHLGFLPPPVRTLVTVGTCVAFLTWFAMPLANRILGSWLRGSGPPAEQAATLAGIMLALAGAAAVFTALT